MAPEPVTISQEQSSRNQRKLLSEFESMIKVYKINRPVMKTKISHFFESNNLTNDSKQMNEFILCYVDRITHLQSFNLSDLHMQILEFIVESQLVSAKEIILMILETNFDYQNEVLWRNALKLIRKIISQVDYKGVRDILGHLLSQFPKLPNTGYALDNQRRNHLEELILFIISPEENLLPAYFVLDEVQKKKSIWKSASHTFQRKIAIFIDRFYNIAAMVSCTNRSPLLIISTLVQNHWLTLNNEGKLKLKGHLPYNPSITAPQKELILFLLEQNRSLDNILSLIQTFGNSKERNHFFEDSLVELVLRAIVKFGQRDCEKPLQAPSPMWDMRLEQLRAKEAIKKQPSQQILIEFFEFLKKSFHVRQAELIKFNFYDFVGRADQQQQSRKFWQHITLVFLTFSADYFAPNISFHDVLDGICNKVEKLLKRSDRLVWKQSRDCFMLFLLQILSRQRSSISPINILKLFQIIEIFYSSDDETNDNQKLNENNSFQMSTNSNNDQEMDSSTDGCFPIENDEDTIDTVYRYSGAALFVYLNNVCSLDPGLSDLITNIPKALVEKVSRIWRCKEPGSGWNSPYFNVVLCHAYSSNKAISHEILKNFFENLNWNQPIAMDLLESLPTPGKIYLLNHIFTALKNFTQNKCPPTLSYLSHLETFSRLFNRNTESYLKFDLMLLKSFLMHFLSNMQRSPPNWSHFYTLFELISTRFAHCRVQVLHNINSKPWMSLANHPQIFLGMEQATLKTVTNFFSADFLQLQHKIRNSAEALSFLPQDSTELNMLFVLSLGRAIHIHDFETFDPLSSFFTELLNHIKSNIKLTWSRAMYDCFPAFLRKYYQNDVSGYSINDNNDEHDKREESLFDSRRNEFEEAFRHFKMLNSDTEIVSHLTHSSVLPYLYCIVFKSLMDGDQWKSIIHKILIQVGFQPQPEMLRTFADYVLNQACNLDDARLERTLSILNEMIWKLNLFSLDRFILYMSMRPAQSREAFSGLYITQGLLLKNVSFTRQVSDYISTIPSSHWSVCDGIKNNREFLEKYPEKFYFEHANDDIYGVSREDTCTVAFPILFDNICLRLLPVLDVVIHRFIELPANEQTACFMAQLLKAYADLYKFHDNPITYLYYTLHSYFDALKGKGEFKRQLVFTVVDAFYNCRPAGWALSQQFVNYYHSEVGIEVFDDNYYCSIINRLYLALVTPSSSPLHKIDYRFNEFPNAGVHGVYSTCIEMLALPEEPTTIGRKLIEVYSGYMYRTDEQLSITTTALAMLFITLPDCYNSVLYDEIFRVFESYKNTSGAFKSIGLLLQTMNHDRIFSSPYGRIMSLVHSYLNNANHSKMSNFPIFIRERLRPNIETEEQFIFVCYLIGPSLNRFFIERTRCVLDVTTELYDMLRIVDKKIDEFKYADTICDLLYHIKYQFTGDSVKDLIIPKINELRPAMREKLRHIVKFNEYSV